MGVKQPFEENASGDYRVIIISSAAICTTLRCSIFSLTLFCIIMNITLSETSFTTIEYLELPQTKRQFPNNGLSIKLYIRRYIIILTNILTNNGLC